VKQPAQLPDWASVFVTVTVTAPAAWAGVVAVIEVALTTTTLVAALPPIVTVAPAAKPVPLIVTAVPPAAGPEVGAMLLTVGAAARPKQLGNENEAIRVLQLKVPLDFRYSFVYQNVQSSTGSTVIAL